MLDRFQVRTWVAGPGVQPSACHAQARPAAGPPGTAYGARSGCAQVSCATGVRPAGVPQTSSAR